MIIHYCRIFNNSISLDGKELFRSDSGQNFYELAYTHFNIDYPKFYKMDNLSKAGFLAAELLMADALVKQKYPPERISVVLSNAHGSLDTDLKYDASLQVIPSPALFVYTLPNIVAGEICIRHKIKGENAFFVARHFDAELLHGYVSFLRPDNLCLAGWVDVIGDHHDVFLYLLDNSDAGQPHTASTLKELYKKDYGTVNGQPEAPDH